MSGQDRSQITEDFGREQEVRRVNIFGPPALLPPYLRNYMEDFWQHEQARGKQPPWEAVSVRAKMDNIDRRADRTEGWVLWAVIVLFVITGLLPVVWKYL